MINAAIVGLGWWGKTLVESLADGSDVMRFVALQTRTVSPDVEAFAKQHKLRLADSYEAVLRRSEDRRGGAGDAALGPHAADRSRRPPPASTSSAKSRSPSPRARPKTAVAAVRKARRALGVGYNRRFHPEMIKLRERIRSGDLGVIQHVEAT